MYWIINEAKNDAGWWEDAVNLSYAEQLKAAEAGDGYLPSAFFARNFVCGDEVVEVSNEEITVDDFVKKIEQKRIRLKGEKENKSYWIRWNENCYFDLSKVRWVQFDEFGITMDFVSDFRHPEEVKMLEFEFKENMFKSLKEFFKECEKRHVPNLFQ